MSQTAICRRKKAIGKKKDQSEFLHYYRPFQDFKKVLERINEKYALNIFTHSLKDPKKENLLTQFVVNNCMYFINQPTSRK